MSPLITYVMIITWIGLIIQPFVAGTTAPNDFGMRSRRECGITRYPDLCLQTLLAESSGQMTVGHGFIVSHLLNKTILETRLLTTFFPGLVARAEQELLASNGKASLMQHVKSISDHCTDFLSMAVRRLEQSSEALKKFPASRDKLEDIKTYITAAMTLQQACKDEYSFSMEAINSHLGLDKFGSQLATKMDYLSRLSSNALALVNAQTGAKSHKPRDSETRGSSFPIWVLKRDRKMLMNKVVDANVVVAQDGSGNYKTVTEAIKAASGGRFVIYVKSGVYKEKIQISKNGITLIGDGKYATVIDWDSSVAKGSSLSSSATITITGDGFVARDIGFKNSAGPQGDQAVTLTLASDRSVLYRCSITGYQDTLYALILRQFYRECDISGTVDFIFGNAAAVFQNCDLIIRQPQSNRKPYNVVLAQGRFDSGQNSGFSVQGCRIKSESSVKSYLGRPWKEYSRAVVMQSTMDGSVDPRGWIEWPGYGSSVLKTLYFAEYANEGPGAGTSGRVKWGGYRVIGTEEAGEYTVGNFIGGSSWLPSTGVTFISGL